MSPAVALVLLGGLLAASRPVAAGVTLRLDGAASGSEAPELRLLATNTGDTPAVDVLPEVTIAHVHLTGDAVTLPPGAEHEWRLALPIPTASGTFAAITRVTYTDAGAPSSLPVVALVAMPGARPSPVRCSLATAAAAGYTQAHLVVDNPGPRPIAGRLIFVLPTTLHTEPESQAIQVDAGGQRVVPFALEERGARPGTSYPVFVVLEYMDDGATFTVLARADTTVPTGASRRLLPLAVGVAATTVMVALLVFAIRRAAARAPR